MKRGIEMAIEVLGRDYLPTAPIMDALEQSLLEAGQADEAYALLLKENARLRALVQRMFETTTPYNNDSLTFSEDVVAEWKAMNPAMEGGAK
jgi:hypothetical protein